MSDLQADVAEPGPRRTTTMDYLPAPEPQRAGSALCLSGGGFRATLFHLGALRRLNELGVLGHLDMVSSVSGGSIMNAFLAARVRPWPEPGRVFPEWDRLVATPVRDFCAHNLRTPAIARSLLPWNLPHPDVAVRSLALAYERGITPAALASLPTHPSFIFCATNVVTGVNWEFRSDGMGDYLVGTAQPGNWSIGRAVAASSCFPPVFQPLPVGVAAREFKGGKYDGPNREQVIAGSTLTDGGVYDNMGLEPVWKTSRLVLVSDGGGLFAREATPNPFLLPLRYNTIIHNQAGAVRKRWLIANFEARIMSGTYWGIGSAVASYGLTGGYSKSLASQVIGTIRTDLDAFSREEAAVLENHGYLLADAAVRRHVLPGAPDQVPVADAALRPPHPEWLDEDRVKRALATSQKRTLLGRR
jgi:NTE family protein